MSPCSSFYNQLMMGSNQWTTPCYPAWLPKDRVVDSDRVIQLNRKSPKSNATQGLTAVFSSIVIFRAPSPIRAAVLIRLCRALSGSHECYTLHLAPRQSQRAGIHPLRSTRYYEP